MKEHDDELSNLLRLAAVVTDADCCFLVLLKSGKTKTVFAGWTPGIATEVDTHSVILSRDNAFVELLAQELPHVAKRLVGGFEHGAQSVASPTAGLYDLLSKIDVDEDAS